MKVQDKVFVVTGGGSGMGRELVLQLLERGARVAAADINVVTLQETLALATLGAASARLSTHVVNIADRTAVMALPDAVIAAHGAVDGLINNAGIIQPFVRVNDLAYEAIDRVMEVNFFGTLYMVKAFLPHLLARPEAHIANVSSMGGFLPVPGQTVYGASKAAVRLLTEGLYAELIESNVHVTAIFPGAIGTNITVNSGIAIDLAAAESSSQRMRPMEPAAAATMMIEGIEQDKFNVFVGRDATMMDKFYRVSPKRATRYIAKQMKMLLG